VAALNSVQPYDWANFLRTRTQTVEPHAPLGGIERGGWKLVYNSTRTDLWNATEVERKVWDFTYSLGLVVKEDGTVQDVAIGGPAQKAGIAPDDKLIAVNNRQWTAVVLRDAVQKTASMTQKIELLIKRGEYYSTHPVEYGGGERFPHLERDETKPDLLTKIL